MSKGLEIKVNNKKVHLGYSRIAKYLECPKSYEYTYVHGLRSESNATLRGGTCYHEIVEALCNYKMTTGGKLANLENALIAAEHYGEKNDLTPAKTQSVKIAVETFYKYLYPRHTPIAVEKKFRIHRGGYEITGVIDLIVAEGWVIDHKFSYDTWANERAKHGPQPIIYQWAAEDVLEKELGFKFKGFAYNIVRTFPSPKIQELIIKPLSKSESDWWEEQVNIIGRAVEGGHFPARPAEKHCGWCPAKKLCQPAVYTPTSKEYSEHDDEF